MKRISIVIVLLVVCLITVSGVSANSRSNPAKIGELIKADIGYKSIELELLDVKRIGREHPGLSLFTSVPTGHEILMGKFRIKVNQGVNHSFNLSFSDFQAVSSKGFIIPNSIVMAIEDSLFQDADRIEFYGVNELEGWTWLLVRMDDKNPQIVYRRGLAGQVWFDPNTMPMIELGGLGIAEAKVKLTQAGYTLGNVMEVIDTSVMVGTVVDHYPASGQKIYRSTPIDIWVSKLSDNTVIVPDFRGLNLGKVKTHLVELELNMGNSWPEFNTSYSEGQVIEQIPVPGTEVQTGCRIDFVYSEVPTQPTSPPEISTELGEEPLSSRQDLWNSLEVTVKVPNGLEQEIVILVNDDFGIREIYREWEEGGERLIRTIYGRGANAKFQVYIGGQLFGDFRF